MKNLLVVVDYQNDFVDGALGFEEAQALEEGIAALVEKRLSEGWAVVFTRDTHGADYLSTREGRFLPVPHCLKGSKGHRLYGRLAAYETEKDPRWKVIDKVTFGSADLPKTALEMCGGVPQRAELCGVVTNICVLSNAVVLQTAFPDTPVAVHGDLCAAAGGAHQPALEALKGLGVEIL